MIIGITGTDGAGKGEVVRYLVEEKGFTHYSSRALLIEELKKRERPVDRNHMRLVANELRKEKGNDYVVQAALERIEEEKPENAVIESLRAVAEAETLKERGGVLLAVDADQKVRYERVQKRRSESDQVSFEAFKEHEALEMNDPDPHGMQKQKVIEMADYLIENNSTIKELHDGVTHILTKIGS